MDVDDAAPSQDVGGLAVDVAPGQGPTANPATALECALLAPGGTPDAVVVPLRLAAALVEITRLTVRGSDVRRLLHDLARTASRALGDDVWVSVDLGHPAEPSLLATSDEEAAVTDGLQVRTGEGPCVDAFEERRTVRVDDVAGQPRWPRLRAVWAESPAAAVVGVPIVAGGEKVGCLNCYSPVPGSLTEARAREAEVLADACGAAVETVNETARLREAIAQLNQAMASRAVIDQAKGVVMARRGGTPDEAFAHLAALSQQRNVKVRDLARTLVEQTGATPAVRRRPPS